MSEKPRTEQEVAERQAMLKGERGAKRYVEFPRMLYRDGDVMIVKDTDELDEAIAEEWSTQAPPPVKNLKRRVHPGQPAQPMPPPQSNSMPPPLSSTGVPMDAPVTPARNRTGRRRP